MNEYIAEKLINYRNMKRNNLWLLSSSHQWQNEAMSPSPKLSWTAFLLRFFCSSRFLLLLLDFCHPHRVFCYPLQFFLPTVVKLDNLKPPMILDRQLSLIWTLRGSHGTSKGCSKPLSSMAFNLIPGIEELNRYR